MNIDDPQPDSTPDSIDQLLKALSDKLEEFQTKLEETKAQQAIPPDVPRFRTRW